MQSTRHDFIARQVIQSLGAPQGLLDIQIKPLWDDFYRVNVRVGQNVTSARIADSFFLTANVEGRILRSSPAIIKLY